VVRLYTVPRLSDWADPAFLAMLDELALSHGRDRPHRKHWEFAWALLGLKHLGAIRPDALAVAVGAGREHPVYWLSNHVRRVHATDIYGAGDFAESDAPAEMLVHPERFAPFPYREDALVTQHMDGCKLRYPGESFDIALSLSSIEHFGGHRRARDAVCEMARVLRPGGVLAIATELVLNGVRHREFFREAEITRYLTAPCGLRVLDAPSLAPDPELVADPLDLSGEWADRFPHVVLRAGRAVFTSVMVFMQKPGGPPRP
jgi:SAM-dependent methyltransferase